MLHDHVATAAAVAELPTPRLPDPYPRRPTPGPDPKLSPGRCKCVWV